MPPIDPFFLIGILGMTCILVAFFMGQTHRWSQDDLLYDLLNALGSFALVAYGIAGRVWPFVILNALWGALSLWDAVAHDRWTLRPRRRRFPFTRLR